LKFIIVINGSALVQDGDLSKYLVLLWDTWHYT